MYFAILAMTSTSAAQQPPARPDDSASCRRFTQAFYDWYVPYLQKELKVPASDIALERKPEVFSPELLRALKEDSAAQARVKEEIVGLDFDPFVGSQDPADRYETRKVTLEGNVCSVEVWGVSAEAGKSAKPDVVAQLTQVKGHWQFLNFRYPMNADLISVLGILRKDRQKRQTPQGRGK